MSGKKPTDPGDDKEPEKRRPGGSRKKDRPLTRKEIERISSLWFKGQTAAQISKRTKIDQATVERQIKEWEDRSLADAQREAALADKLEQLAGKAHDVSVHPGLSDRERHARLQKLTSAIKKTAPEAFECNVVVAELLEAGGDACWLRIVLVAKECRARISNKWDESAVASPGDVKKELAELKAKRKAEDALPADQKQRRREIRKSNPSEN